MELSRAPARHGRSSTIAALLLGAATFGGLGGCMSKAVNDAATVPSVPRVDLPRYMGPWFIIGAIGLGLEKGAHNAVETYTLNPDGTIATVFQFRKDGFDGALETKVTRAWIVEGSDNAEWKVRTFWPLKQQYRIAHLEPDFSSAIVARDRRDYVWILSRTPRIDQARYLAYLRKIEAMGYDLEKFSRYPQDGRLPDQGPADLAQARP